MSHFRVELLSDNRVETGCDYRPSLGCFQRGFVCLFISECLCSVLTCRPTKKEQNSAGSYWNARNAPYSMWTQLYIPCFFAFGWFFRCFSVLWDAERHLSGRPCLRKRVDSDQTKWLGAKFCPVNSAIWLIASSLSSSSSTNGREKEIQDVFDLDVLYFFFFLSEMKHQVCDILLIKRIRWDSLTVA